jgi:hypothetical protein
LNGPVIIPSEFASILDRRSARWAFFRRKLRQTSCYKGVCPGTCPRSNRPRPIQSRGRRPAPNTRDIRCVALAAGPATRLAACRRPARARLRCNWFRRLAAIPSLLVHRRGRDQIFLTVGCLDAPTVEMALGTIALNAARGAGEACPSVALDGLLDGESEIAVGAGRDGSSVITLMIPRLVPRLARYPQWGSETVIAFLRTRFVISEVSVRPDKKSASARHRQTVANDPVADDRTSLGYVQ